MALDDPVRVSRDPGSPPKECSRRWLLAAAAGLGSLELHAFPDGRLQGPTPDAGWR